MKSEVVSFPAVTLCNFRSLDFDVINRINRLTHQPPDHREPDYGTVQDGGDEADDEQNYDPPDDIQANFTTWDEFMDRYLVFMSSLTHIKLSDRMADTQVREAVQVNSRCVLEPLILKGKQEQQLLLS